MIFRTDSKRVEVEYTRGVIFFVRLPLLGEVLCTRVEAWRFWPWPTVKAALQRNTNERRAAGCPPILATRLKWSPIES
jgi:hypothetical protein